MVTIEQVAKYAGVSVATVSRTLNDSPSVRPATARRVREAIEALNYIPNQSARNLRKNESRVILALAPNFSNPYYSRILTGIGDQAREKGYSVLICNSSGHTDSVRRFLEMLDTRRADAAVLLGCPKDARWIENYMSRFPMVLCCEYVDGLSCASVSIDNYQAAGDMVRYLQSLGHERIAMLGADNMLISTKLRRESYYKAMKAAGLTVPKAYYVTADADYSFASGQLAVRELLKTEPRPTAIFCVSDILALSAISVAQELGLSVPEDLTVTGFDDVDYTTMAHPFLTTVAQPCYEMGRRSAEILLDMLSEGEERSVGRRFLEHRIVVRESAAVPPKNYL